jgi:uncharacterized protein YuzE
MASVYVHLRDATIPTAVSTHELGENNGEAIEVDYDHNGEVIGIAFSGAKWVAVNGVRLRLPDED